MKKVIPLLIALALIVFEHVSIEQTCNYVLTVLHEGTARSCYSRKGQVQIQRTVSAEAIPTRGGNSLNGRETILEPTSTPP
jgi:hypothetical protein